MILCMLLAVSAFAVDSDRDGLTDDVEASLGSSPMHKDIFVEIDWLVVNGRSMKPRPGFAQIVTSIFDSAPVTNPDGTAGIRIHLEFSNAIKTNRQTVGSFTPIFPSSYDWTEFDSIKQQFFAQSKRNTHHYVLFAKDIGDTDGLPSGISGISRNVASIKAGASDFIVALGGNYWFNYPKPAEYKWTQAGTFVHELGHNLGLRHGGLDNTSYKPNLLSVMSYCYQTDGIPYTYTGGRRAYLYDYSRRSLPPLNENSLNEFNGLGAGARDASGVYGATWFHYDGEKFEQFQTFDATRNVDWDRSGSLGSGVRTNLNQDFTYDPQGNAHHKYSTLRGFAEWSKLVYDGGLIGKIAATVLPATTHTRCLDATQHRRMRRTEISDIPRITRADVARRK